MGNKPKAIIFDWGRTLHDIESGDLFDGVPDLIKKLSESYVIAIVTLAKSEPTEIRLKRIRQSNIAPYLGCVFAGEEDKDGMYEKALVHMGLQPTEVVVVDDRALRGIGWGNKRGAMTIWLRKGKFAEELPNAETGNPSHVISDIRELSALL